MGLFQQGNYVLASGLCSFFKIECDDLTEGDWEVVAWLVSLRVAPFSEVVGVPTGGWLMQEKLMPYRNLSADRLLICDDVFTTGGSIERQKHVSCKYLSTGYADKVIGAVLFARNVTPDWITPVFQLTVPQ